MCGISKTGGGDRHAFIWEGGRIRDLGTLGGTTSWGYGINDVGESVGSALTADDRDHAFIFRRNRMQDIGAAAGHSSSDAFAINRSGAIVGWDLEPGSGYAIVWERGKPSKLPDLGLKQHWSGAFGINASGDIAGFSRRDTGETRAVLWENRTPIELPTLGGVNSVAFGINDRGVSVGYSDLPDGKESPCLWSGGKVTDLGTLGGRDGCAYAINNHGDVVGVSPLPRTGPLSHAFLYTHGKLLDLNDLIPPDSGWSLDTAAGINDNGEIVGSGIVGGHTHAFLLKPTKRSGTAVAPLSGVRAGPRSGTVDDDPM